MCLSQVVRMAEYWKKKQKSANRYMLFVRYHLFRLLQKSAQPSEGLFLLRLSVSCYFAENFNAPLLLKVTTKRRIINRARINWWQSIINLVINFPRVFVWKPCEATQDVSRAYTRLYFCAIIAWGFRATCAFWTFTFYLCLLRFEQFRNFGIIYHICLLRKTHFFGSFLGGLGRIPKPKWPFSHQN